MKKSKTEIQIEEVCGVKKTITYEVVDAEEYNKCLDNTHEIYLENTCNSCMLVKYNKVITSIPTTIPDWLLKTACIERLEMDNITDPVESVLDYVSGNSVLHSLLKTVLAEDNIADPEKFRVKAKEGIDICADDMIRCQN